MNKSLFVSIFTLITLASGHLGAGQIAITFDDAPLPGSKLVSGKDKTTAIIKALKQHQVPNATFFLTMQNISDKKDEQRLKQYADAGFTLAHHSYRHISASKNDFTLYKKDFLEADQKLFSLKLDNVIKQHRFPFLHHGDTDDKRAKLKKLLADNGYSLGYVTVDNFDWYINSKAVEAFNNGAQIDFENLKKLYIDALWHSVTFYDELAKKYLNRSPKHVLLLHENEMAALFLGDLIAHIKSQGWQIISPAEAYKDPIANPRGELSFNKQGRIAALAHAKGADKKELRSKTEKIPYLDKLFAEYQVIKGQPQAHEQSN